MFLDPVPSIFMLYATLKHWKSNWQAGPRDKAITTQSFEGSYSVAGIYGGGGGGGRREVDIIR